MLITKIGLIDSSTVNSGCDKSPNLILNKLKEIGTNEKGKAIANWELNFNEIHIDLNNIPESNHNIFETSKEIFEKHSKAFFIGGDHLISYSIISAFKKIQNDPLVIVFDAHADCFETSSGISSRNWLRKLIEERYDSSRLLLVSSRNLDLDEIKFIKDNSITWIKMDILSEDLSGVCDLVMERARKSEGFYLSIDIDAVDPAFAPGVALIEPGGLSSRDLIYFIKRLVLLENFKGADIVNINPYKDINEMTLKLGAKILAEMI